MNKFLEQQKNQKVKQNDYFRQYTTVLHENGLNYNIFQKHPQTPKANSAHRQINKSSLKPDKEDLKKKHIRENQAFRLKEHRAEALKSLFAVDVYMSRCLCNIHKFR